MLLGYYWLFVTGVSKELVASVLRLVERIKFLQKNQNRLRAVMSEQNNLTSLVHLASLAHETNCDVETLSLELVLCLHKQRSYFDSRLGELVTSAIKVLGLLEA
jgi:hypothetical protein